MRYSVVKNIVLLFIIIVTGITACKEPFLPPLAKSDASYLVIDGSLILQTDSSFFQLSRTRPLGSAASNARELRAKIQVFNASGTMVAQSIELGNGRYVILSAALNASGTYKFKIITQDGKEYATGDVEPYQTPEIDSITWIHDSLGRNGIQFNVNTHDPLMKTEYYRWEYDETWQYTSYYFSMDDYDPVRNAVFQRDTSKYMYICWQSYKSNEILLGSSNSLSEHVINKAPIRFVPKGEDKFNFRYSILVKQFALSKEAHEYWNNLKQMTELGGSIFDVQPSELVGNIFCTTDEAERVIGFISVQTMAQKRIFVESREVSRSLFVGFIPGVCELKMVVHPDSLRYYFGSGRLIPVVTEPTPSGGEMYFGSEAKCVDCRLRGGTNKKPAFW